MEPFETLQPGMEYEVSYLVEENHTASHVGSGALSVLSTPSMIGFMERSSHQMLAKYLTDGFSSVGVRVDISHLAPTPVGASIRVRAEETLNAVIDGSGNIEYTGRARVTKSVTGAGSIERM